MVALVKHSNAGSKDSISMEYAAGMRLLLIVYFIKQVDESFPDEGEKS